MLLGAVLLLGAVGSAQADKGCRMIIYSEPGHPDYQDVSFAIKVSGISCSRAGSVLTYPLFGYDGTVRHGARGLSGFLHAGFRCSAHVIYPVGKYYIAFSCRNHQRRIRFRWNNVG